MEPMRVRIYYAAYAGYGMIEGVEGNRYLVRPDDPMTFEDYIHLALPPSVQKSFKREQEEMLFMDMARAGCVDQDMVVKCLPLDDFFLEFEAAFPGLVGFWIERRGVGYERHSEGGWFGKIVSVDGDDILFEPSEPVQILDAPESLNLSAVRPGFLDGEVHMLSLGLYRLWGRLEGDTVPEGEIRKIEIPYRRHWPSFFKGLLRDIWMIHTFRWPKEPGPQMKSEKRYVLYAPVPLGELTDFCSRHGLPDTECVFQGARLKSIPLTRTDMGGLTVSLKPPPPEYWV